MARISKVKISYLMAFLTIIAIVPQCVMAQGESAVPFLLIAPNARADGMGEAGAAIADDASAVFWNPAGLAFQTKAEASITHSQWLPQFGLSDLFYDYLAFCYPIPEWLGTASASVTYLNLGEFAYTTTSSTPEFYFKAYELAATIGYSTKIFEELGLGVNLRYIRSSLAPFEAYGGGSGRKGVGETVSFDIATLWKPTSLGLLEDRLNIGLNISNIGPKLIYIDAAQADPLPTNLRLGLAGKIIQSEFNNLTAHVDFSRLLVRRHTFDTTTGTAQPPDPVYKAIFTSWYDAGFKKVTIGSGLEYWYGSPRLIALRFGYFYEHPKYGNRKFLTFGAGIRYDVYGFDFSYLSTVEENHPLAETLRFTLSIAWGGEEEY